MSILYSTTPMLFFLICISTSSSLDFGLWWRAEAEKSRTKQTAGVSPGGGNCFDLLTFFLLWFVPPSEGKELVDENDGKGNYLGLSLSLSPSLALYIVYLLLFLLLLHLWGCVCCACERTNGRTFALLCLSLLCSMR